MLGFFRKSAAARQRETEAKMREMAQAVTVAIHTVRGEANARVAALDERVKLLEKAATMPLPQHPESR